MCKKGWWCLYFDRDLKLDVCAGFGCPKEVFINDVIRTHSPKVILAINKMKLDKESKQILKEMNEKLKGEEDGFIR